MYYVFLVVAFLVKRARLSQWLVFLVGAFLVKRARLLQWLVFSRRFSREKCPTLTVASFFFRQTTDLIVCTTFYRLHSRSHVLVSTRFTVNPAVTGSSPCFSQKLFRPISFGAVRLFQFFFGTVRLFFLEIFVCRQRVPLQVF